MKDRRSSKSVHRRAAATGRLWKAAIVSVSAHVGLWLTRDLLARPWLTLFWLAVGFVGVVVAERQFCVQGAELTGVRLLTIGLLLRALMLPVPPSLSSDVRRYVWDGRVINAGHNPYALSPDASELEPFRDDLWEELDHREVATVYPPLAQMLFALSARLPSPLYALKTVLALCDLLTCVMLWNLARRWNLPGERVLWYAWNPLVTVEGAGMGHIDILGVALVVLTTLILVGPVRRVGVAAGAASAAVLAKLVPLIAIPIWARQSRRPRLFVGMALLLSVVGLLPIVLTTGGAPPGLVRYAISWEHNGPLFEPLWRTLDWFRVESFVEASLDRVKHASGRHQFWNLFYPFNYPQLWAKIVLALGLIVALGWSWKSRPALVALRRAFGAVLLFSATVYPWYALWVLPWAALSRAWPWLALSALLFLSYLPQLLGVTLLPWVYCSIWVPFFLLMLRCR